MSSLGGSHFAQPTLQEWEVMLHFLKDRASTSNTWNSYTQQICLFSLMYSFIQSFFISVWTHEYFILWVPERFYFLVQIISTLNSGCSFRCLLCSCDTPRSMWALISFLFFFNTPLSSATTRCYRYVNYISIKLKGGKT